MEELQSTEILDREILEDARKKAHRILKAADETVKANTAEWEKKAERGLDELKREYLLKGEIAAREIITRLPMEKRRLKVQVIDKLLSQAVEFWYKGLERGRVLAILKKELQKRIEESAEFAKADSRALYHKLSRAEAENILRELLPGHIFSFEEHNAGAAFPELIIENSAIRITASISKTVDFFLQKNRMELTEALLGTAFLTGEEASVDQNSGARS
jgi:hypothetical protein